MHHQLAPQHYTFAAMVGENPQPHYAVSETHLDELSLELARENRNVEVSKHQYTSSGEWKHIGSTIICRGEEAA